MYTITEFSRICKMSTRMLRHYDKEEILKPAYVDPINGYRYYEQGQLEMALRVKKLREYKFPLPKIKLILHSSDQDTFIGHMQAQIIELSHEVKQNLQIISEMTEILHTNTELIPKQHRAYDILSGMRNEATVITQRFKMNIHDMDIHFESLYKKVQENAFQIIGSPVAIFHDEEYIPNESDIELIIPIIYENNECTSQEWKMKTVAKHQVVTTLHYGNYDSIGYGYIALEEWIEKNGYLVDTPPYEVYIKGSECNCSVDEYVTQICFPVINIEQ
ncbi:MerR family transcriptional regulator [Priestia taiwanensis]|uniref:MerR family transcriptional regulator n=1 Tax=Priestia taiwanensis TaxID=1347902 RepID=A0A917AMC1_9BACI|nr:MerR family transcriptional regulator [Priestia taiwanensis]MBM7362386.1 DNA-binding transcriptional MerR regulator [Priestia taiwanensis]GGE61767.1 MerR family transcriptional regulator [Priestia taiwanensis]